MHSNTFSSLEGKLPGYLICKKGREKFNWLYWLLILSCSNSLVNEKSLSLSADQNTYSWGGACAEPLRTQKQRPTEKWKWDKIRLGASSGQNLHPDCALVWNDLRWVLVELTFPDPQVLGSLRWLRSSVNFKFIMLVLKGQVLRTKTPVMGDSFQNPYIESRTWPPQRMQDYLHQTKWIVFSSFNSRTSRGDMTLTIVLIVLYFVQHVMSHPRISSPRANFTRSLVKRDEIPTFSIDRSCRGNPQIQTIVDDWQRIAQVTARRMSLGDRDPRFQWAFQVIFGITMDNPREFDFDLLEQPCTASAFVECK